MNKDYIYSNGQVRVRTDKDTIDIEYQDNIHEILIKENVIEASQKTYDELKSSKHFYSMLRKITRIGVAFPIVFFTLISVIFKASIDITIFALIFGGVFSGIIYSLYKEATNKENGINAQLEFFEELIKEEKENLENLKRNKIKNKTPLNDELNMVNDLEEIKKIIDKLNLYYDCGNNERRYYNHYNRTGKLNKSLVEEYNSEEQELIKEYLEERGKKLSRRIKGK